MSDHRLVEMLLLSSPPRVALVGEPIFRLSELLSRETNRSSYTATAPEISKTNRIEQYIEACLAAECDAADCVMCLHLPAHTDDIESLLGLACRTSPRLLLVEHRADEYSETLLADEQFFAFGFRILGKYTESGCQQALYAYSLSDYKQAPEWLNARFWANPERFGAAE